MLPGSGLFLTVAAACFACGMACGSRSLQDRDPSTIAGAAGIGAGATGGAGGFGPPPAPPCPDSDPRLVVAPQGTFLLTSTQLINMIRALVNDTEASTIVYDSVFPVTTRVQMRFPPGRFDRHQITDPSEMEPFTNVAKHVGQYVFDNFQLATQCAPPTDACAKAFLGAFAERAYRRPLDAVEQGDLDSRYEATRSMGTVQDATREVVTAILVAPPFLYRSEMGDASNPSSTPPGLPLTPYELASALSFFLTDGPPDRLLLADARAGTLSATLGAHVDRLLATATARDWLRTVVETLFRLNQLPATSLNPDKFPIARSGALYQDLQQQAYLFLDDTLWNATLGDLLLSKTTFLNSNLATYFYEVPVPAGATATNFVPVMLPTDQRSGILTNAGFLTTLSNFERGSLLFRGLAVNSAMLGRSTPAHDGIEQEFEAGFELLPGQTAQEQVAYRSSRPACAPCHAHFDPYGVALDNYDAIGRFRTVGDMGEPVDAHATLPPELGGVTVAGAIDLARVIAGSAAFENGMAANMLTYALSGWSAEIPDPSTGAAGCAVADVTHRFDAGGARTFSALLRAVALSPAFSLRRPAP